MNQKTMKKGNQNNIYHPNPTDFGEYTYLPQATTLQGAYEMRSIQPTATNIATPQGGQTEEITDIQDTREHVDALMKRKKWALQLCLSIEYLHSIKIKYYDFGVSYHNTFI